MTRTRFIGVATASRSSAATSRWRAPTARAPPHRFASARRFPSHRARRAPWSSSTRAARPTSTRHRHDRGRAAPDCRRPRPRRVRRRSWSRFRCRRKRMAPGFDHAELGWNPQRARAAAALRPAALRRALLHGVAGDADGDPAQRSAVRHEGRQLSRAPTSSPRATSRRRACRQRARSRRWGCTGRASTSPELTGQPFTSTFIFGSWDGQFIFVEPMVTKAYLETHPNATTSIPQPARWSTPGRYPTTYTVAYDANAKEYRFVLGGLTKRP